jgi:hypothetical protein
MADSMPLIKRSTPEESAAKAEQRRQHQDEKERQKHHKKFEAAWRAFWLSPAGEARRAFADGDHVFQFSIDVLNQQAIIIAMTGSMTRKRTADPTAVLTSVCREGWELVNGDFVFVMTGQESRDKFLASGQNVAVAGTVMGYYLFKRCEAHRDAETDEDLKRRLLGELEST